MKTICLLTYILAGFLVMTPCKPSAATLPLLNINLQETKPLPATRPENSETLTWPKGEGNQRQLIALKSCQKSIYQNAVAWLRSKTTCNRNDVLKESKPIYQPIERKNKGVIPLYTSELPS